MAYELVLKKLSPDEQMVRMERSAGEAKMLKKKWQPISCSSAGMKAYLTGDLGS